MRNKDAVLLGLLAALLAALLAPALSSTSLILGNFGDLYAYHLPLRHFAASRLMAGQMPFWNPYVFSGLPFLANPQAALFYPPSVLFDVLPAGCAFTLHAAFHLALAALGMQLFLRRARLDAAWAFLFTASFTLSPMLVYRIPQGIPTQLAALSWVPWTWLALLSGRPAMLAGAWALQLLAGHAQYAAVNAVGLAVFALFDLRARAPVFAKAAGLAAGLACVQLVLTAQFLGASNRVGWPPALAGAYSLPPRSLAALVLPGAFGNPLDGSYPGLPSTFFEFQAATVGWAAAILAAAGLFLRSGTPAGSLFGAAPWLIAGLGVFAALGDHNPLLPRLANWPIFGLLRAPARFGLLLFWGLLLAAAAAALKLRSKRILPRWAKAAALAVVFADLGPWAARFVYAEDPRPFLSRNEAFARRLAGQAVRFITDPDLANPNKAMLYRAMNANGYEAFYLKNYTEFILRAAHPGAVDPSRVLMWPSDRGALRALGVRWLLGPDGALSPNPGALPLARLSDGRPAQVSALSPDRWRISGSSGTRMIFAMPFFPGWKVWLNGRRAEISREEGLFQAVELPSGGRSWTADFRFGPTLWPWLVLANAAAAALWLARARRMF
ncbi:MAG: hypothetical protein HY922_17785 [Elusimicrobia bacterium]|nr:hypothetical protein [Elusimicrobiota bacterium]